MPAARPTAKAKLEETRRDAADCRRCGLWRNATQVVFGQGPVSARLVLVGEQPGDVEDREGVPFVGPAGRLLRDVLEEAGLDAEDVYLTNAVKHFKWRPRGTRRIHDTPSWSEVTACHVWLRAELEAVRPELLVLLGRTATQALLGRKARVTALRGRVLEAPELATPVVVTLHPSAVLRAGDDRGRRREELRHDLALARSSLTLPRAGVAPASSG